MKNKFTRLASVMLVLTLLSTCVISGTYAKYVTTASSTDAARVADFGVTIKTWHNNLFEDHYATTDISYTKTDDTVESIHSIRQVVAPGTESQSSVSFEISGTPEVAVKVDFTVEKRKEVAVMKDGGTDGRYPDWTTADKEDDTFALEADYYPVRFSLEKDDEVVAEGNLDSIQSALTTLSKQYAPNTNLSKEIGEYKLSWKWIFEDKRTPEYKEYIDKLDTLLGQVAAGTDATDYVGKVSTDLDFDLTISVTQID